MSITAQFLADRFERTTHNATAIIDAERMAREAKTARLRELRLAKEQEAKGRRKPRAKRPPAKATHAKASK